MYAQCEASLFYASPFPVDNSGNTTAFVVLFNNEYTILSELIVDDAYTLTTSDPMVYLTLRNIDDNSVITNGTPPLTFFDFQGSWVRNDSIIIITISGALKKLFNGEVLDVFFFSLEIKDNFDLAELFYDIHIFSNYTLISLISFHILAVIIHKIIFKYEMYHKFMTLTGWCQVKHMIINITKIGILENNKIIYDTLISLSVFCKYNEVITNYTECEVYPYQSGDTLRISLQFFEA